MVSNSTFHLIFKKPSLVEFQCGIKKNVQLSERAAYLCEAELSSCIDTSTRTALQWFKGRSSLNAEADMQLSSIKTDIKEMCKNVKQGCSPHLICFVLEKNIFH